jgi:hypothetical protein
MSQFKVFTNNDLNAPVLNGLTGSLINILNYCLITGSGWLQPSASVANCAIYQQPSGSNCILYINDNGPSAVIGQEAWATGWEVLTSMGKPCGTGSGQFPRPEQLLTDGRFVVRKSNTANNVSREWVMFSDDRTFYFFAKTVDTNAYVYAPLFFGDFYTSNYSMDPKPCFLSAKTTDNQGNSSAYEHNDQISYAQMVTTTTDRSVGGLGGITPRTCGTMKYPAWIFKLGDMTKAFNSYTGANYDSMHGVVNVIGQIDNTMYICPLTVWQGNLNGGMIRGRFRGMYHIPSATSFFVDGQIIVGTQEHQGKMFQIIKPGINDGMWVIEISDTLETNN